MWFRKRRERRAAWHRLSAFADRIGARDGQVVFDRGTGDLFQSVSYSIITIRKGRPDDVARDLLDRVMAMGYTTRHNKPPCTMPEPCGFIPEGNLPSLYLATVPEGNLIQLSNTVIPAGHTAVIITID